ncbi:hypothetical protein FAGAP_4899 [Fusarium agapanthi]|uniref:Uncharacterized protein n=1 Tax=Fusarium agapanthi TaxID=1803897 RepID=A0A9P5BHR3_9HYPO|nr:hypothetical protein FAGAP_4899 [Fusarium agapanthi]
MGVPQHRYIRASKYPSPSESPSEEASSISDGSIIVGVTPQTLQRIRLYFHGLWQIKEPISLPFQDTQIVTFDDSVLPVNGLSQALARKRFYPHDSDHNDQSGSNFPRGRHNLGPGQRQQSGSMTFNWKQTIMAMLAILVIPQWRRLFSPSDISHSPQFPIQRSMVELANTVDSMPGMLANIMEGLHDYIGICRPSSVFLNDGQLPAYTRMKKQGWPCSDTYLSYPDLVIMNLPEALQNLEYYLISSFLSLNNVSELDLQLSLILQKLDLRAKEYTYNETELLLAWRYLRHLRGETQRRVEELEACHALLKRILLTRYGREGREYAAKVFLHLSPTSKDDLDISALISITLGIENRETARSHMGGLWRHIERSNRGRDYDVGFPSIEEQLEILIFARRGRFRSSDTRDS